MVETRGVYSRIDVLAETVVAKYCISIEPLIHHLWSIIFKSGGLIVC